MRRLAALLAATCLVAGMARAESVSVRGGEHPGFTRLVFSFAALPDWSVSENDSGYRIALPSPDPPELDLSRAYRLVDRSRIGDIVARPGGIDLILGCPCTADFHELSGALVVDIRERGGRHPDPEDPPVVPAGVPMPAFPALPETGDEKILLPMRVADLRGTASPAAPPAPAKATAPPFSPEPGPIAALPFAADQAHSGIGELGFGIDSASQSRAVELLSRELSRAAAQGLVEANPEPFAREPAHEPPASLSEALSDRANLSVVTGLDQGTKAERSILPPTNDGSVCLNDSEVDLAAWGDPTDPLVLGRLRSAAVAENGNLDPAGAAALARYYIVLGFGAEARALSGFMPRGPEQDLIRALGEIVDDGSSGVGILDGQIFCEGRIALWATLARPVDPNRRPASTNDVLAAFSELPVHLRIHLGPVLSQRLREVGLEEEARNALNAVTRGGQNSDESELTAARLGLSGTRADDARDDLATLSRGTNVTAAEALLELLEDAENRGVAPDPTWVEDVPSLVRATQGTDVAARLNRAGLRGHIALGQFDRLRTALAEEATGLVLETRTELAARGLAAAAAVADNVMFLETELALSRLARPEDMSRTGRVDAAERLMLLGLAGRARGYLPDDPGTKRELAIAAEVMQTSGASEEAINLLSGRPDPLILSQLGRILSQGGRETDAVEAFERGGHREKATGAALRAGNWDWIAENGADEIAVAANALLPAKGEAGGDGAANGALLLSAAERRRQARQLLEATRPENFAAFTN